MRIVLNCRHCHGNSENSLKSHFLQGCLIKPNNALLIFINTCMLCPTVAPVFGFVEIGTVTIKTAKISKLLKCSKINETLQEC